LPLPPPLLARRLRHEGVRALRGGDVAFSGPKHPQQVELRHAATLLKSWEKIPSLND